MACGIIGGIVSEGTCVFGATVVTTLSFGAGVASYTCIIPAWLAGSATGTAVGAGVAVGTATGTQLAGNILYSVGQKNNSDLVSKGGPGGKATSQLKNEVNKGQKPKGVDRVDLPRIPNEKPHVHFDDGRALNKDGTWKHNPKGNNNLTNKQKKWLEDNGWQTP